MAPAVMSAPFSKPRVTGDVWIGGSACTGCDMAIIVRNPAASIHTGRLCSLLGMCPPILIYSARNGSRVLVLSLSSDP